MRENLLGYLLGALEDDERRQIESQLEVNAQLQDELIQLRLQLNVLVDDCDVDPPIDLAERTCRLVEEQRTQQGVSPLRPVKRTSSAVDATGRTPHHRWNLADLIVTAGVFLATAMLFFPAILNSRYQAQRTICENNLCQLGVALLDYNQRNTHLPHVAEEGKLAFAGVYTTKLKDAELLPKREIVLCPGDPQLEQHLDLHIATEEELLRASGLKLREMQDTNGGSFGYALGYVDANGRYRPVRAQGRNNVYLVADHPNPQSTGNIQWNHIGQGQNLLSEGGHVRFTVNCDDGLFVSDRQRVEAGRHEQDTVIAGSSANPNVSIMSAY